MTELYYRPGSPPSELLFEAYDDTGRLWTDLANNPDGFEACGFLLAPPKPDDTDEQFAVWTGDSWVMEDRPPVPVPDPPTMAVLINAERDRRIASPFTFEGHPYQSDDESRQRIDKSRGSAMAAVMGGAQPGDLRWTGVDVDFFWIALDDTRVTMDAQTMIRLGNASAAREGLLIVAANDLKRRVAGGEVIADLGDDALWP